MKKIFLALMIPMIAGACAGGGRPDEDATVPWSMDPQSSYVVEAEGEGDEARVSGPAAQNADGENAVEARNERAFRQGCEMIMRTVWAETDQGRYIIEAESKSVECEGADLSLAIRAPNRRVVYRANLKSNEVYGFADVTNPLDMRGALIDWATNYGQLTKGSNRLPYWPRGAATPTVAGAYPLILDPVWNRLSYLEVRRLDVPVYCHIVDFESLNCMVLNDPEQDVVPLGVQKFPARNGQSASAQQAAQ